VLYYEAKIKSIVAERWSAHQNDVPDNEKVTLPPLWFRNKVTKELYDEETQEVKDKVEKRREKSLSVSEDEIESGNEIDKEEAKRRAVARSYQK
jgi:hypothetical protein